MTYTIVGLCKDAGELGFAMTTSSVCAGARVGLVLPRQCVVLSQARTDPRLHRVGAEAFVRTKDVDKAVEAMRENVVQPHWRQLGIMNYDGAASYFTGESCLDVAGGVLGKGCFALGNSVANGNVLGAMVKGFEDASGPLAERLIAGLKGGDAAGGETLPLQSASLQVYGEYDFATANLRIDKHPDPLTALTELWDDWATKSDAYITRAINPDAALPADQIENLIAK